LSRDDSDVCLGGGGIGCEPVSLQNEVDSDHFGDSVAERRVTREMKSGCSRAVFCNGIESALGIRLVDCVKMELGSMFITTTPVASLARMKTVRFCAPRRPRGVLIVWEKAPGGFVPVWKVGDA